MIKVFGLVIWTSKDVERLYKTMNRTSEVAAEAKDGSMRFMKRSETMFDFIMRNLPLKRKRKALRRLLAEANKLIK